ncbi:flagellin [Stagnimonas aquatica]|uniref:Flagellin n=1 Tax=Stagnimonas aquatica TaxID=2689987 RepID=A0A3N0V598_9GAMM|nr:flagellin [Stagnimonas aquatica]ROH87762.1 flagellin [Stagnimonas aquatica]
MQVINTNVASLNAQRNLNASQSSLNTSLQRLSSGLRINSAKDDAAGLAISERMTSQIRGLDQASRNANDGISLAQTAEGALVEVSNNLQRIRELAVQSRNATNSQTDRDALNTEAQQLMSEINRVAGQTNFNGVKLLDGSFTNQSFQVGANAGETVDIASIVNANASNLGTYSRAEVTGVAATTFTAITAGDLTINGTSVGAVAAATSASERAGGIRDAVNSVSDTTGVYAINETATTVTLVSASGNIVTAFAGATATAATTGLAAGTTTATSSTGFASLDLSSVAGADTAMQSMDAALSAVNTARASLGAYQNRFTSVVASLATQSENLSASRSRIQDADFAKETAALTRGQILQQAGTAMLSQANSAPQSVMSLLRG